MIVLNKILSTRVKGGLRLVKMLLFGNKNAVEVKQVGPYGVDSNPVAGMEAIYVKTSANGGRVVAGYVNKGVLAEVGEMRLFSTDEDGNLITYVWLKNEAGAGQIELGGDTDNAVRYAALNTALQNDIVTYFTTELAAIATGIAAGGGSYTPTPISVDISGAKVDEIAVP